MYCTEPGKTAEIGNIQRKYLADTMLVHRCGQSGIVHLNSRDVVLHNDFSPLSVHFLAVCQQTHPCFDYLHFPLGIRDP